MATYKELQDRADRLVLVPTNCVILAREWDPDGATPITTVVDEDGVLLDFAALGFETVGMIDQKAGVDMSPDLKFGAIMGYGARGARRRPKESEDFSLGFTIQEQRSIGTRIAMNILSEQIVADGQGGWYVKKEDTDDALYWDVLVIAYDGKLGSEIYPWWWYPRMGLSEGGKKAMSMTEALGEPVTLSVFEDDTNGLYYRGITGEGWAPLSGLGGFPGATAWDVAITGSPAGGTYQLTVTLNGDTQTTSALAYNAATSAVQAALVALSNVGVAGAVVSGTPTAYEVTLANGGVLGKGTIALTGGTTPNVTITPA
jgi:hypothetical protein